MGWGRVELEEAVLFLWSFGGMHFKSSSLGLHHFVGEFLVTRSVKCFMFSFSSRREIKDSGFDLLVFFFQLMDRHFNSSHSFARRRIRLLQFISWVLPIMNLPRYLVAPWLFFRFLKNCRFFRSWGYSRLLIRLYCQEMFWQFLLRGFELFLLCYQVVWRWLD